MRRRGLTTALLIASLVVLYALPAWAQNDNGEGWAGETNDKVVTFFSLGVLVFFPLVALLFTLVEHRLEKRHEERHAAQLRQRGPSH